MSTAKKQSDLRAAYLTDLHLLMGLQDTQLPSGRHRSYRHMINTSPQVAEPI